MNFKTEDLPKILALIDDAMEKKDREVTIFISKDHTHITVTPHTDNKPRWIHHQLDRCRYKFECSECGAYENHMSSYCPHCGEKLAAPILKDEEEKNDG